VEDNDATLFGSTLYTILSMSCANSFLRPNKLATIFVLVVTDSPYLNYSLNIYVKRYVTLVSVTVKLMCVISFTCLIVLCLITVNIAMSAANVNVFLMLVYSSLIYLIKHIQREQQYRTLQLAVYISEVRSNLNELTE